MSTQAPDTQPSGGNQAPESGDDLLVAPRSGMAEDHPPQAFEVELKAGRPARHRTADLLRELPLAPCVKLALSGQDEPFLVSLQEPRIAVAEEGVTLGLKWPQQEVTTADDCFGVFLIDRPQHSFERREIAVDVVQDRRCPDHWLGYER